MVLEWTPEEPSLFQDQPFSAVTSVYTSRETWQTQNHRTFSSTSLLGTLGPGGRRLCMRLALHDLSLLHLKRASDSEPPVNGYPSTKGQETLCHSHHSTHIVSCMCFILHSCLHGVHVLHEALVAHASQSVIIQVAHKAI